MTLLGDAAHLMSQFGGFGVNLALLDAVELARALAGSSTVDSPIFRCEKIMMVRSDPLAGGGNEALVDLFAPEECDLSDIPDCAEEERCYKESVAEYRRAHVESAPRPIDQLRALLSWPGITGAGGIAGRRGRGW